MFKRAIFLMSILVMMAGFAYAAPPAEVPKTGQTTIYYAGDDGDIQAGVAWPLPRFTDNEDGTVTDNLTGLVWTQDGNIMPSENSGWDNDGTDDGKVTWQHALDYVAHLNDDNYLDHSDWRLPNVNELQSLIDFSQSNPCLPSGNPFTNVTNEEGDWCWYWSSTTYAYTTSFAWDVSMGWGPMGGGLPGCRL